MGIDLLSFYHLYYFPAEHISVNLMYANINRWEMLCRFRHKRYLFMSKVNEDSLNICHSIDDGQHIVTRLNVFVFRVYDNKVAVLNIFSIDICLVLG